LILLAEWQERHQKLLSVSMLALVQVIYPCLRVPVVATDASDHLLMQLDPDWYYVMDHSWYKLIQVLPWTLAVKYVNQAAVARIGCYVTSSITSERK